MMTTKRRDGWITAVMLTTSVLVCYGVWREITHHDGVLLVVVAASAMPALVAWLVRQSKAP